MPTIQDFIKDLAVKGKVDQNNPDFATVIGAGALKEVELPQSFVDQFHKEFLTREAALSDRDIFDAHEKTARGKFYGILDGKVAQFLNAFGEYLTDEQKEDIKKVPDTPGKLDLINRYVPASVQAKIKAPKTSDEEKRRLEEDYNKKVKEEKEKLEGEWTLKLLAKQKEFEDEQISNFVTQKIFSYNLQDKLPGGKEYLANSTISQLHKDFHLKYENGVGVHLFKKDDPEKNVFVNNNKLTLDAVLNEKLQDYVKKSDAQNGSNNKSPFTVPEKPQSQMSLAEINAIKVQQEAQKLANKYQVK